MRRREFPASIDPPTCAFRDLKVEKVATPPFPPLNPFGPSSLMPQSEMNPPAHLRERRIKENLNYRVVSPETELTLSFSQFLQHPKVLLKGF